MPHFKDDDYLSEDVKRLQRGILDYTAHYASVSKYLSDDVRVEPEVVEDLFHDIIASHTLTEDIATALVVEDSYCRDGVQKFDITTGTWKVD